MPGTTKHRAQAIKTQGVPQLREGPDIAKVPGGIKTQDRWCHRCHGQRRALAGNPLQARDDRLELGVELIDAPQRCNGALLGSASLVSVGRHELDVLVGAAAGELDEHATTVSEICDCKNIKKNKYSRHYNI